MGVRAAVDCSDGFLADLGHVASGSAVRVRVAVDALPLSPPLRRLAEGDRDRILAFAMTGGDDYELILAGDAALEPRLRALAARCGCALTAVGEVLEPVGAPADALAAPAGLIQLSWHGEALPLPPRLGYEHAV